MNRSRERGGLIGLVYFLIYLVMAIWPAGAGHGTYIFFVPLWPYLLGGLVYPAFGFVGADLSSRAIKFGYLSLILTRYLAILFFFKFTDLANWDYVTTVSKFSSEVLIIPAAFFLMGQIAIWLTLVVQVSRPVFRPQ